MNLRPSRKCRVRLHLVFLILLTVSLCATATLSKKTNIAAFQWQYFVKNRLGTWRGLRQRVLLNGTIRSDSLASRIHTIPDGEDPKNPQSTIQTTIVTSPTWYSNGDTVRKFLNENGNPISLGRRIYPNGTIGAPVTSAPGEEPVGPFAKPNGDTLSVPLRLPGNPVWAYELSLFHPRDPEVHFKITAIYVGGQFNYVFTQREVRNVPTYPTRFWTLDRKAFPRAEVPSLCMRRFWKGKTSCVFKNFDLTTHERREVVAALDMPSQPKERMFTLELPDDVTLVYPKSLADYNKSNLQFMVIWVVDSRTVVQSIVHFDTKGRFTKECITTFTKTMAVDIVQRKCPKSK